SALQVFPPDRNVSRLIVVDAQQSADDPASYGEAKVASSCHRQFVDEIDDHPQNESGDHREVYRLRERPKVRSARVGMLMHDRRSAQEHAGSVRDTMWRPCNIRVAERRYMRLWLRARFVER